MRNIEYIEYNLGSLGIHQVDLDLTPNKTSSSTIWLTFCIATVMRCLSFKRFRQWMYWPLQTHINKITRIHIRTTWRRTNGLLFSVCDSVIVNHFLRNSKQLLGWHCWQQSAVRNKTSSYFLSIDVNRRCKMMSSIFSVFLKLIKQQEN